ncbi:MAG: hypothetical protein ACYCV7_11410 [Acidimicrobiales bacterium]
MDAEHPSLVCTGRNHSPAPDATHDNGTSDQTGVVQDLDGSEESIHVDMQDRPTATLTPAGPPGIDAMPLPSAVPKTLPDITAFIH